MNVRAERFPLLQRRARVLPLGTGHPVGRLGAGGRQRRLLLGFAGALVAGSLSYYLVERPALSLKRLVPLRQRQDDEALAEPAPAAPVSAP
jgi:peptidoglycan/LPS O-acetylase OafA/YrhL